MGFQRRETARWWWLSLWKEISARAAGEVHEKKESMALGLTRREGEGMDVVGCKRGGGGVRRSRAAFGKGRGRRR